MHRGWIHLWAEKGIKGDVLHGSDPHGSTLKGRKAGVVGGQKDLDLKVWGGIEGAQVVRRDLDLLAGEPCGEATRAGSSSPALHWLITALSLLAPCALSAGTAPKPHATRRKNTHISHVLHQPKHTNKHHTNAGTSSRLNSLTVTKTLDGMLKMSCLFSIKEALCLWEREYRWWSWIFQSSYEWCCDAGLYLWVRWSRVLFVVLGQQRARRLFLQAPRQFPVLIT